MSEKHYSIVAFAEFLIIIGSTRQVYRRMFPNRRAPSNGTIRNIIEIFRDNVSLDKKVRTVPVTLIFKF